MYKNVWNCNNEIDIDIVTHTTQQEVITQIEFQPGKLLTNNTLADIIRKTSIGGAFLPLNTLKGLLNELLYCFRIRITIFLID